jgi:nicotinate dehydrogenase subunit A
MAQIDLTVNGNAYCVTVAEETPLLDVLRNMLGLRGSRFGCGLEQCGCCTVIIDGKAEQACTKPIWSVAGKAITTIEGMGTEERPHPLQRALLELQAGQCGYCLSGILMASKALLDRNQSPSRAEIADALKGNICRCGTHNRIIRAVERAAAEMREQKVE